MADCTCSNFPADLGNVTFGERIVMGPGGDGPADSIIYINSPETPTGNRYGYIEVRINYPNNPTDRWRFGGFDHSNGTRLWQLHRDTTPLLTVKASGEVGIGAGSPETILMLQKPNSASGALTPLLKLQTDGGNNEGPMIKFAATMAPNVAKAFIAYQVYQPGGGYGGNGKLYLGVASSTEPTDVSVNDAKLRYRGMATWASGRPRRTRACT